MVKGPLAGAAGPGEFSVRTDGLSLPSASYGEGIETANIEAGAPMAKTPDVNPISLSEQGMAPSQIKNKVVGLFERSQRSDEDIMTGSPIGPGPGPEVLGINAITPKQKTSDILVKMLPFDNTGEIAILLQEAQARGD